MGCLIGKIKISLQINWNLRIKNENTQVFQNCPKKDDYTTARQVLAFHYMLESLKAKNNNSAKARFIGFLTNKNYENVLKKVKSPFSKRNKELIEDLKYVQEYFLDLDIADIVYLINKKLEALKNLQKLG